MLAATNADLDALVNEGEFRRDLYYRVRVVELVVPPLASRGAVDIQRLTDHFLDLYARRHRRRIRGITAEAMARLQDHPWPGNVRELEHLMESAVVLCPGDIIEAGHLPLPSGDSDPGGAGSGYAPGTPLSIVERDHIRRTVEACGGNRSEAARKLGIGRNTLQRKLK